MYFLENIVNNVSTLLNISPTSYILITLSFFIGSIPFGLLISSIAGYGDIRKIGSGNIGATNVLRTGNKTIAFCTLMADLLKGLIALYINKIFLFNIMDSSLLSLQYCLASIAVVMGHMFSPWVKFKGGKGIATSAGILIFISWPCFILSALTWSMIAISSKKSSLGSLFSSIAAPIFLWSFHQLNRIDFFIIFPNTYISEIYSLSLISILIWIKHYENIFRILKNEEPKMK